MKKMIVTLFAVVTTMLCCMGAENIKIGSTRSSSNLKGYASANATDGKISDKSRWIGKADSDGLVWLELIFTRKQKVSGVHLYSGYSDSSPIQGFYFEFRNNAGHWVRIPSSVIAGNRSVALSLPFDTTVEVYTDALRLIVTESQDNLARIKEIFVWPETGKAIPEIKALPTTDKAQGSVPLIYLNQSGFSLGKPKRFTAPTLKDDCVFQVINKRRGEAEFEGVIRGNRGDFSSFNPDNQDEFFIKAGGHESFPFRIAHWWLERISYRNAVTFMDQSRHNFGNYTKSCKGSFGWRDDHHFGWELNTLVPQYLSNPSAYDRMAKTINYKRKENFNGALEPFNEDVPDIVKLIHFGADVIVTQKVEHAFLKEQLAFFVYAWPALKQWLPEQNYTVVRDYIFSVWGKETVKRNYPYDKNKNHNLFELDTLIGTNKGELPPGHTVLPNLLMYEVAKREARTEAEDYFKAAYTQVAWIVDNLDWNDPLTTKGQRMSEHVTMTGLALMLKKYSDRAPKGLKEKIETWKKVAISRSDNMWDFRKLSDTQWCPTGTKRTMWNEPGNLLGFPAVALAVITATPDSPLNNRLRQISKAQMDNAFGRNPTGRHFSYDATREIEGCDLGWYSFHHGGIGQLAKTHFVFDGAPKNEHYPYNPKVGNVGWTEGWVQFNTAFNLSLAYMAYDDTELKVNKESGTILLKAPLNFDCNKVETACVQVVRNGVIENVKLREESENSAWLSVTNFDFSGVSEITYGYGYMRHRSIIK